MAFQIGLNRAFMGSNECAFQTEHLLSMHRVLHALVAYVLTWGLTGSGLGGR